MARPKKSPAEQEESAPIKAGSDPLILTISQLAQLSDEDKQAFRDNGGTVTSDPQ